jgi:hypothetical protein
MGLKISDCVILIVGAVFNRDSLGLAEPHVLPAPADRRTVIWSIDHIFSVIRLGCLRQAQAPSTSIGDRCWLLFSGFLLFNLEPLNAEPVQG